MNSSSGVNTLSIIGLGLLGSSLAAAVKRKHPEVEIRGISSPATVQKALRLRLIDKGYGYAEVNQAVAPSDLVVLCTPITHIIKLLNTWQKKQPAFRKACIVTDVGSTKVTICRLGEKAFDKQKRVTFIGSHPMAGSEKTGIDARDPHLFENASWVLCPQPHTAKPRLNKLRSFLEITGARIAIMPPSMHDKVVANVSHLPQIISSALAGFIANQRKVVGNCLQIAGGGFRDMTRLADSSYAVWHPIFSSNKREIRAALSKYVAYLAKVDTEVSDENYEIFFQSGKTLREKLSRQQKGLTGDLAEILLCVPDTPGILASALSKIAAKKINVLDLEILKVREGESGTIRMAFRKHQEAEKAARTLTEHGFEAYVR